MLKMRALAWKLSRTAPSAEPPSTACSPRAPCRGPAVPPGAARDAPGRYRGFRIGGEGETPRRASESRPAPGLGGRTGVEGAIGADEQRTDLILRRVVQDRRLAVGSNSVDQALAVAAGIDGPIGAN